MINMTMLGMTKDGQVIEGRGTRNTVVVGAVGSGKGFGYIVPNILLEEEKSMLVMDWWKELEHTYPYKEAQGYQIFTYDLSKEGVLQTFQEDLRSKREQKRMMYVTGYYEVCGKQVYELLEELQKVQWEEGLHVFLDNYENYRFSQVENMFQVCKGNRISLSLILQSVTTLQELRNIQDNCDYILFKGGHSPEECKWICKQVGEVLISKEGERETFRTVQRDEILCMGSNTALLLSHDEPSRFIETLNTDGIVKCGSNK
ncbi:type IV secretory system conjugative DNA transfer family protein [Bacillus thuringiensis]|uniref:type IV secretory system conjugative DNA transfer family protein n=1 Tax=Bacillus thuringiensis TaxID=1428 RepID=UPI0032420F73